MKGTTLSGTRHAFVGGIAALTLMTAALPATAATYRPVLPTPTGNIEVGTVDLHLVDTQRRDPWHTDQQRELMVSVHCPAFDTGRYPLAPWLSSGMVG